MQTYRALIIGATGAVGSALLAELLRSARCTEVVALTRREIQHLPANLSHKLNQQVIDFNDLEPAAARAGRGCEVAFCTMGIGQPRKVSSEEFWKVDVDYAGAFARGAQVAGAQHITLLSSAGANAKSSNRYIRVKGSAEAAVAAAGIRRTSLFRPSLLVTKEIRYGLQDRLTQSLFPLLSPLLPDRYHEIRVEELGRAMQINAERDGAPGVEILHYSNFLGLAR
ncbi:MAG TPA: NAD(P)H-binding protein [Thermoanaerobaculia bacterium]|nr:NAD(P)H-binding protein [Thermoanaerobaculia bacterium]